jgi:hypothetical protein
MTISGGDDIKKLVERNGGLMHDKIMLTLCLWKNVSEICDLLCSITFK